MSARPDPAANASFSARACTVRASLAGIGVAAVFGLLAVVLGVTGVLPDGTLTYALLGIAAAVVTGIIGVWMHSTLATVPADQPGASQRYLLSLAGNWVLQLIAVVVGMLVIRAIGVKFEAMVAFGLAFMPAATGLHVASSLVIANALRDRARSQRAADAGSRADADPADAVDLSSSPH